MKKNPLILLIFTALLTAGFGRAFLFFGGGNQPVASQLAMIYFPFPSPSPDGWEALPTTNGLWTKERMLRDIKRLKKSHVSIILFALPLERLSPPSPYFIKDCQHFLQLCQGENITVLPLISASKIISRSEQSVIVQYIEDVWNKKDDSGSQPARTLCFLADEAVNWRVRNPMIQFVTMPGFTVSKVTTINEKTWLFTSVSGKSESKPSARDREKDVAERLKTLTKRPTRVAVLCFNAWNNYKDSQVIEPNTFDGNSLYEKLVQWAGKHIAGPSKP